jgi:hypothetical protein
MANQTPHKTGKPVLLVSLIALRFSQRILIRWEPYKGNIVTIEIYFQEDLRVYFSCQQATE